MELNPGWRRGLREVTRQGQCDHWLLLEIQQWRSHTRMFPIRRSEPLVIRTDGSSSSVKIRVPADCKRLSAVAPGQSLVRNVAQNRMPQRLVTDMARSDTGRVQHLYWFNSAPTVNCTGKCNYVPVHAMKTYRWRRNKAPLILNLFLFIPYCLNLFRANFWDWVFFLIPWRFGPFSGHGLPAHVSPTISLPFCSLSDPYLKKIYVIPLGHGSLARGPTCCIMRPAATFVILCIL